MQKPGRPEKSNKKEKTRKNSVFLRVFCGALEGTRTPDLLVRSQSLYPAELQAHLFFNSLIIIGAFPANVKGFVKKNQKIFPACGNLFLDKKKNSLLYYAKRRGSSMPVDMEDVIASTVAGMA